MLADADIRDLYGASDFFCLTGMPDPSGRVEGFGLVYLEAAAAGLPSVATRVGGVADAVLADLTGLLVEPSVAAVTHAIQAMIEMPQLGRGLPAPRSIAPVNSRGSAARPAPIRCRWTQHERALIIRPVVEPHGKRRRGRQLRAQPRLSDGRTGR